MVELYAEVRQGISAADNLVPGVDVVCIGLLLCCDKAVEVTRFEPVIVIKEGDPLRVDTEQSFVSVSGCTLFSRVVAGYITCAVCRRPCFSQER